MTGFFEELLPGLKEAKESLSKINHRFSLLRLFLFIAFAGLLIAAFANKNNVVFFVSAGAALLVFIFICVIHGRSRKMESLLTEKIKAAQRYINRGHGDYGDMIFDGSEYKDNSHPFASDLDVFGKHSLFELYNISHSVFGRKAFADKLKLKHFKSLNKEEIVKLQKLVERFSSNPEFLLDYEAVGAVYPISKVPDALLALCAKENVLNRSSKLLYKLMPLIWLVPVVLTVMGLTSYLRVAVLLIILINLVIWFLVSRQDTSDIFKAGMISRQAASVKERVECLLSEEEFREAYVPGYLDESFESDLNALIKACGMCSLREQPVFALILNALMPFDLWCADRLLTWSHVHGKRFMDNVSSLGDIESIMCAAVPGIVARTSSYPVIVEDKQAFFNGEDMTHPLLDPSKAVSNSVIIDSQEALITGSNMSGKTTLIRTVGVMLVLAYMGAKVPSSKVECSIMRIMTSMRIADSLEENMSTFKAELIRIGSIVEASEDQTPLLFLIDEVFRGTNSQDRTDGAEILLNKLNKPYIAGFMTTHDYALCDRAAESKSGNIVFFHFSERYEGDEVIFDYKLRSGLSHESNAMFLMRLVGIE